ncbi:MAG: outer membrane beta-barrel protein [Kordia sp.]|uniref:outer membrane beta-barrel protein n=1 Tax=Kordia sp. TaxID=1965332 RepID=UPI00385A564F
MKKSILFLFICAITIHSIIAQTDDTSNKQHAIKATIGYGFSAPYDDDSNFYGTGFYAQAEYIHTIKEWFDIRPYAGFIFANSDEEATDSTQRVLKADTNAFLLGGKARLKAPIPWVAPFIEVGAGMSVGEFETVTNTFASKESGLIFHIPISFGLVLGPKQNIEIGVTYYYHNTIEQFAGAVTFGVTFPLNKTLKKGQKSRKSRMF